MAVSKLLTSAAATTLALLLPFAPASAADPIVQTPEEAAQSRIAAAFGVGGQVFDLPSLDVGVHADGRGNFDPDPRAQLVGPVYSAAIGGQLGDTPYSLELSGSLSTLNGDASATQSFHGAGSLYVTGLSNLGSGSLDVAVVTGDKGASARSDAEIVDGQGHGAASHQSTQSPADGRTALIGYSPLVKTGGGALTAVGTDGSGPSATAFGAVGSGGTFALAAVGDLGGLSVTTDVDESLDQNIVSLRLGRAFALTGDWAVTPTIAPTYRRIDREIRSATNFDFAAGSVAEARLPDLRVETREDLTANYYGASLGATLSGPVGEGVFFNVGGDLGLAHYDADYSGRSRAQIASDRLDYAFDTGHDQAVDQSRNELTYFGSARAGLSIVQGRTAFSLGAQAEYLADVPTLSRNHYENVVFAADGIAAASGSGSPTSRLTSGDAWSYGGNVGVSFAF